MASQKPLWKFREPATNYDVVIIGGGLHRLATAYYLARDYKISKVAVLERNYLGFGGSSRNTEVIRANQSAPEILPLYDQSNQLWNELDSHSSQHRCGQALLILSSRPSNSIPIRSLGFFSNDMWKRSPQRGDCGGWKMECQKTLKEEPVEYETIPDEEGIIELKKTD